jgi:hypothetical protein
MNVSYSSDELKTLARVLNEILAEARKLRPELSTDDIVQRVCTLADRGERDAKSLYDAALETSQSRRYISEIRVPINRDRGRLRLQNA